MIIMSVDYGDSRTGVAVCDKNEMLASPVCVVCESYEPRLLDKLCELVNEQRPERIVVGLPRNMDGSLGERAEKCIAFSKKLAEVSHIETVLWDERLTTVMAHKALNDVNVRGKKRKNIVDAVAAVMILEDYMASLKK